MSTMADLEQLAAAAEFDALEDRWLEAIEETPTEVDRLASVATTLVGAGEEDLARLLLSMLDDELRTRGEWPARLELLRRHGALLIDDGSLHAEIVATLTNTLGDRPSFEGLSEKVGLHRAPDDLPKTWKKVERLTTLLEIDVGSVIWMEGKGPGRVTEVNLSLDSVQVELDHHPEIRIGFAAVPKLLRPLPEHHIVRRKHQDLDGLKRLRDDAPAELLRLVLESHERPRNAAEIRRDLEGIVSPGQWNAWWAAARKHPQVVVQTSGRTAYSWASSSAAASRATWEDFDRSPPREKLDLYRRLGERDAELRGRMVAALVALAAEAVDDDPGLSCEIWLILDRNGEAAEDAEWAPRRLLEETADPRRLCAGISDRGHRERIYGMLREVGPGWPEQYALLLLQEEEPRNLERLAAPLAERSPEALDRLYDQVTSRPAEAPASFVWVAERAAAEPAWLERGPLRLLRQIVRALGEPPFARFRSRLAALTESGATLPRLLPNLSPDQAHDAAEELRRANGLESYQRDLLLAALELRFPALRKEDTQTLYALSTSIDTKREELRRLLEEELPANRRAIEEARALGDLRENFEYKAARQRHEYLSSRAQGLDRDLQRARPIDVEQVDGGEVVVGSVLSLTDRDGGQRSLTILGPWESRPEVDVLSNESDLARELLGKKPGDEITLAGTSYRIEAIDRYQPPG